MKKIGIIVSGCRNYSNYKVISEGISNYLDGKVVNEDDEIEIIQGGASGVDNCAKIYANENGCNLKQFDANWYKYGSYAGPIRNNIMAKYLYESDFDYKVLLSFWDGKSRGSKNMIDLAKRYNIDTIITTIEIEDDLPRVHPTQVYKFKTNKFRNKDEEWLCISENSIIGYIGVILKCNTRYDIPIYSKGILKDLEYVRDMDEKEFQSIVDNL